MLLTVLALGGTILGATTIAGVLMIYQIRQATDLQQSNKAIFAADAAIEWGNYQLSVATTKELEFQDPDTRARAYCYGFFGLVPDCDPENELIIVIQGLGRSHDANRWFQQGVIDPEDQLPDEGNDEGDGGDGDAVDSG